MPADDRKLELDRKTLEGLSADMPESPLKWKPATWTAVVDGHPLVVKDVSRATPFFRYTMGRLALWREARIYRRLQGVDFVPAFHGHMDRDSIVMERIDARPIHELTHEDIEPRYFDQLDDCVRQMHERGVVHMDLRHRSNLMVSRDGKPRLIDFEASFYLGRNFLARKLLVPLLRFVDRSAVLKYRNRYFPDQINDKQARRIKRYKFVRKLWPFGRLWPIGGVR